MFLTASSEYMFLSSSLVKELAKLWRGSFGFPARRRSFRTFRGELSNEDYPFKEENENMSDRK